MTYYTKTFKDNRSSYPKSHREPIYRLIELHHPMVPNIISVDDEQITYEYVEGTTLKDTDMKSVEDMMWVLSSYMDFVNKLVQVRKKDMFLFENDFTFVFFSVSLLSFGGSIINSTLIIFFF